MIIPFNAIHAPEFLGLNTNSPQAEGLDGWWPTQLHGFDASGHGNHLNLVNMNAQNIKIDDVCNAFEINEGATNDEKLEAGENGTFNAQDFTAQFWLTKLTAGGSFGFIMSQRVSGSSANHSIESDSGDNINLWSTQSGVFTGWESASTISIGTQQHWVVRRYYAGGTEVVDYWVNGVKESGVRIFGTGKTSADNSNSKLTMGAASYGGGVIRMRIANPTHHNVALPDSVCESFFDPAKRWDLFKQPRRIGVAPTATEIAATTGGINITGLDAAVQAGQDTDIAATVGAVSIAGLDSTVQADVDTNIAATVGGVTIAGLDSAVQADVSVVATVGAVSIAGLDSTVGVGLNITATVGALTIAGVDSAVQADTSVTATTGEVTISALDAVVTVAGDIDITATTGAVTIAGLDSIVQTDVDTNITATTGTVAVAGQDASVTASTLITATVGTITIAGLDAGVASNAPVLVAASPGLVTVAGVSPTITTGRPLFNTGKTWPGPTNYDRPATKSYTRR